MKTSKFIEAEQIAFEEITESWVAVKFGDDKFVIDMDTLYDLAFRSASFLAYLEAQEEQQAACACEAVPTEMKVH
ncbi:hypothetical protein EZJ49_15700 [Bdellovibrio bacteriovorus]|uniref:hypothetical protein n=1 Tax=Bdellovibrio bacteriovorus TaxID=959 RepID=UPI0021D3088F|nr:hypothetical protein [Bdellovibrio bacteriovorus]UXR64513.1 hypothetical protein EZJ49_15700 [Bdellovibrio bacteriovorus]